MNKKLQNLEAEQCVIGCMLLESDCAERAEGMQEDDFTTPGNRAIWRAIAQICQDGGVPDIVSTLDKLTANDEDKKSGGLAYLSEATRLVSSTTLFGQYREIVVGLAERRRWIKTLNEGALKMLDTSIGHTDAVQDVLGLIENATSTLDKGEVTSAQQAAMEAYDRIAAKLSGEVQPMLTGLSTFDKLTGGLHDEDLIIIAARTGKGKSALAQQIAMHVGKTRRVLFNSQEMSVEQLGQRALSRMTGIGVDVMRRASVGESEMEALSSALRDVGRLHLDIDTTCHTPRELRVLMRDKGYDLLICDYTQLMRPNEKQDNTTQDIANITWALKQLAKEYKIPVIALSQLNRESDKGSNYNKEPRLSDLRGSGSLEQDADVVVFIHEPHEDDVLDAFCKYWEECQGRDTRYCELKIEKQRSGPTGWVPVEFDAKRMEFICLG